MKMAIGFTCGLLLGVFGGYWLAGYMKAPFGCRMWEERVLTSDLDLAESWYFKGSVDHSAPAIGVLKKGTKFDVGMIKGGVYLSFHTVVSEQRLAETSAKVRDY